MLEEARADPNGDAAESLALLQEAVELTMEPVASGGSQRETWRHCVASADSAFFAEYFGPVDPASSHSECLDRWLLMALPAPLQVGCLCWLVVFGCRLCRAPWACLAPRRAMPLGCWAPFGRPLSLCRVLMARRRPAHPWNYSY